jgi:hypothetical protein
MDSGPRWNDPTWETTKNKKKARTNPGHALKK